MDDTVLSDSVVEDKAAPVNPEMPDAEAVPKVAAADVPDLPPWTGLEDGSEGPALPATLPQVMTGLLTHSLYTSFAQHVDSEQPAERLLAEQLAAHFKRLFFFELDFKRDLRPGDRYSLVWEHTDESTDGLRILAALYESSRHDRLFEAYYYKAAGKAFGRHYDGEGVSVQPELINSPLEEFEQVTSLLRDRRPRHDGIDFKAPVGTPVRLPWDAEVLQVSRRIQRYNGRYIKVRVPNKGLDALFLHLDSVAKEVQSGRRLKAGTLIGRVGNTGRSTAPHLHYQLQTSSGRIRNPYDVHGSRRRSLERADEWPAFSAWRDRCRKWLGYSTPAPIESPAVRP